MAFGGRHTKCTTFFCSLKPDIEFETKSFLFFPSLVAERVVLQLDVQPPHGQHLWFYSRWTAEPEEVRATIPLSRHYSNTLACDNVKVVFFFFPVLPVEQSALIRTPLMPPLPVLLQLAPPTTLGNFQSPSLSLYFSHCINKPLWYWKISAVVLHPSITKPGCYFFQDVVKQGSPTSGPGIVGGP